MLYESLDRWEELISDVPVNIQLNCTLRLQELIWVECLIGKMLLGLLALFKADEVWDKIVDKISFALTLLFHFEGDRNVRQRLVVGVLGGSLSKLFGDNVLIDFELIGAHLFGHITEVVVECNNDFLTIFARQNFV